MSVSSDLLVKDHNFDTFVKEHSQWKKDFKVYQRDDAVFQRMKCCWNENQGLEHEYHATINVNTGEVYLDCRKRKLLAKNITLLVLRPLHTVVKTLWHLSIVLPLLSEAYGVFKKQQTMADLRQHTIHSLQDIVRTPLYGFAMTFLHAASILMAITSPNSLYKNRERIGVLERKMLRVERISQAKSWLLSPCFNPIAQIQIHDIQLVAKNNILFRRQQRALFNDCALLYPTNYAYRSACSP